MMFCSQHLSISVILRLDIVGRRRLEDVGFWLQQDLKPTKYQRHLLLVFYVKLMLEADVILTLNFGHVT